MLVQRYLLVKFNNLLFLLCCIVGFYIVFLPLLPNINYSISRLLQGNKTYNFERSGTGAVVAQPGESVSIVATNSKEVIIPKIGVHGTIYEGKSVTTLDKGIWRRPNASSPDLGSNTVLVAHRFLYTSGPDTFYNLDKLAVGDNVFILWLGKKYSYKVSQTIVVPANAFAIENPTPEPVLTLWTCTPLWTSVNRLVVSAKLISVE